MIRTAGLVRVLLGPAVLRRCADDYEYNRRATTLFTLYALAIALLPLFAIRAWARGEVQHCLINAAVFALEVGAYVYTRISGNLLAGIYLGLAVLSAQFATDFTSDTNRAMWSLPISVLSFFLLGERAGAWYAAGYFALLVLLTAVSAPPRAYPAEFRLRFAVIYACMTVVAWLFERSRRSTHNQLVRSRALGLRQRDIITALASAEERDEVLGRVVEILCSVPPLDCGGAYVIDPVSGAMRLVAHRGLSPAFVAQATEYAPQDPHTVTVKRGKAIYATHRTLGVSVAREALAEGIRALAVAPIVCEGVVAGALNVASHTEDHIPDDVRTMLESAAADVGAMLRRLKAVGELRALSARYEAILSAVPDIIMEVDNRKVYTWANKAGKEFFGDDVVGKEASGFFIRDQDTYRKVAPLFGGDADTVYLESWQRRKDGEARLLAWWCRPLKDGSGRVIGALSSARDITENRRLEEQLSQARKMDAVGQLAGGIAHDFNNQLGAVIGFAELIKRRAGQDDKLSGYADRVLTAANRAADLTARLLAFARKGSYEIGIVDVHRIIAEVVAILKQTIDRRIQIAQDLAATPATVKGDATQIQTALLNLALNARDAMPDGGTLTFATSRVDLDESYCRALPYELAPGNYVQIRVSDTGCGMSDEVLKHVFEPFFTTKPVGKGTGMGLSAVYGIVKAHLGAVTLKSSQGQGTTVTILLPWGPSPASATKETGPAPPSAAARRLRVLVVDDEKGMREAVQGLLGELGHAAVMCGDAGDAIDRCASSDERFDLVVLDMVMPGMSAAQAFRNLRKALPQTSFLLMSGYTASHEAQELLTEPATAFIQKPFGATELARGINELVPTHE